MKQKITADRERLEGFLGSKEWEILEALGYDRLPNDHNPIWEALAGLSPFSDEEIDELVEAGDMFEHEAEALRETQARGSELAELIEPFVWNGKRPNKGALLRAYVICQTNVLNNSGGPIGNRELGTLRQRWYASKSDRAMGFKFVSQALERYYVRSADVVKVPDERTMSQARVQGAQRVEFKVTFKAKQQKELEQELGRDALVYTWPKDGWGRVYAQTHSAILADLVRDGLTYEELWVREASRDVETYQPLLPQFHGILILEKQGLFEHFQKFCERAGVPILLAMSGNNAFSGVETIINDSLRDWEGRLKPTSENPLKMFSITDFDPAGMGPVEAGAVAQFERYLPGAVELHRVGVMPDQLRELGRSVIQAGYEIEVKNQMYQDWADEFGVKIGDRVYGIELEALTPEQYVKALIEAMVKALGGDDELKERLATMAEPNWGHVRRTLTNEVNGMSDLINKLAMLKDWAEEREYEQRSIGETFIDGAIGDDDDDEAWRNEDRVKELIEERVKEQKDSIEIDDFVGHVSGKSWGYGSWRPVDSDQADRAVMDVFRDEKSDEMEQTAKGIDEVGQELIDDLDKVLEILSKWID